MKRICENRRSWIVKNPFLLSCQRVKQLMSIYLFYCFPTQDTGYIKYHLPKHRTFFTALVLIRLLQAKLENKYPVGRIIELLKKYCCIPLDTNNYKFTYFDDILNSCEKAFDIELSNRYRTRQQIQRILKYLFF